MEQQPVADILLVTSFDCEIDAATFEINMMNYSQNIMIKQFQQQSKAPPHKYTLLRNRYLEEKHFLLFLSTKIIDNINI